MAVAPIDMRYGFISLSSLSLTYLSVDVTKGKDWVVFISKNRNIAKIIGCDEKGNILITKYLNEGKYQQLMMKATGAACREITISDLEKLLNGEKLEIKRTNILKG